jgi:N-acetylmuramoyl-L-alanine amidase
LVAPVFAADGKIDITVGDETKEITTIDRSGLKYFSFSELSQELGGSLDWEIIGHKISYSDADRKMRFLIGSPYFTRDKDALNMTYPAVYHAGQLFLPVKTFLAFLGDDISIKGETRPVTQAKRPVIKSGAYNVADLSISARANGLLIEIYLTGPVAYDAFLSEGNWLNVSVRNGKVNAPQIESRLEKRYMYDLKTHQVGGTGQVSLWMRYPITKWEHHLADDPDRIQISISDSAYCADSTSALSALGPDKKIDVVVVDAGHGGQDYGAIGFNGTREKDVSLAIAREVATQLRRIKKLTVVMTRSEDKAVSLQQRADIANNAGADLFVSIHANANPKQGVRGWNVFFLAPAKNDSARAVEQLENSYFLRENSAFRAHVEKDEDDAVVGILNEMIMTEFQAESHDFALMLDRELRRELPNSSRGIDQAGFFVLNKVFTPSVLIESAFITNPSEERLLRTKSFQQQVAKSVADAVERFKAKYDKR